MVSTKLWNHLAWQRNLDTLAEAGVDFIDVQTGRPGTPEPVESGTGDEVVTRFDPAWLLRPLDAPARKS
jgi:hypothetical protein